MSALPYLAGGTALAVARWEYPRAVERAVARRLPIGANGVIRGAEPISLDGRSPRGVLLLHGFGDTPQSVALLAFALHARGYTVRVPLLAGHGRTLREFARGDGRAWLEGARAAWQDLRAVCSHASLAGQSLGGALTALLAAESPEARALVLLAPYLDVPATVRRLAPVAPALEWIMPYLTTNDSRSILDPTARAQTLSFEATTPRLTLELMAIADRARAALPALRLPTLYVQPRQDNRIAPAVAERMFGMIGSPERRFEWLESSGHVAAADREHALVATLAANWLDGR